MGDAELRHYEDKGMLALALFFLAWLAFVYFTSHYFGWDAHMASHH